MRTRHKEAIHRQMNKLFSAAYALEKMIKDDDIRWANDEWWNGGEGNKKEDEVALLILNLSNNCEEMSKVFNFSR